MFANDEIQGGPWGALFANDEIRAGLDNFKDIKFYDKILDKILSKILTFAQRT